MMGTKAFAQCDRRKAATTVPLNFIVSFLLFVWGTVYLFTGIYIYIYTYVIWVMVIGPLIFLSLSLPIGRRSRFSMCLYVCMYVCMCMYRHGYSDYCTAVHRLPSPCQCQASRNRFFSSSKWNVELGRA